MLKKLSIIVLAFSLVTSRQINKAGLNLIKEFEGFYSHFYKDSVGIETIGYGHACHVNDCSKIHAPITKAEGEKILLDDLKSHESCVEGQVPFVNDNQFAASSTLLKDVKAKNYQAAANEFGQFVHAGGRVLAGLVRRRAAEKKLFLTKV